MARHMNATIIFQHDNSILSADMTAIFTFIATTLSGSYTIRTMEVSNCGNILLKLA